MPAIGYSQLKDDKLISNLDSVEYDLTPKTFAPSDIRLPFKRIEIIDARFDTSKLGFDLHRRFVHADFKDFLKIKLTGGVKTAIQQFYNEYYKLCFTDSSNELLMVLKTLWINDLPNRHFLEGIRYDIIRESYKDIYTRVEYYLRKGSDYYPLKRIDTVYQLTEQNLHSDDLKFKKHDLSFFMFSIKSLIESCDFDELVMGAALKRKLSIQNIDSFNTSRFILPILDVSIPQKGVFMSFKEFANNAPSVNEYNYRITKKGKMEIRGDSISDHFYFAFADTSGLHVQPSKKPNMIRIGHTFEFIVLAEAPLPMSVGGNILSMSGRGKKVILVDVPRQINMETGEIY